MAVASLVSPSSVNGHDSAPRLVRAARSGIHGRGVYARVAIPDGTRIIEYTGERITKAESVNFEEARRRIVATIAAGRFGRPEEFGDACAFLCSAQAGFISGQNLQLDGGSYRGLI